MASPAPGLIRRKSAGESSEGGGPTSPTNSSSGVGAGSSSSGAAAASAAASDPGHPSHVPQPVARRLFSNAARAWDPNETFTEPELWLLLMYFDVTRMTPGAPVIRNKAKATSIIFVLSGETKVMVNGTAVATMGAGTILGVQAFFNRAQVRTADVVAGEGTILASIDYDVVGAIASSNLDLYVRFLQLLCTQSIVSVQRMVIDRQQMNVPLFDESVVARDSKLREVEALVKLGAHSALYDLPLPPLPATLNVDVGASMHDSLHGAAASAAATAAAAAATTFDGESAPGGPGDVDGAGAGAGAGGGLQGAGSSSSAAAASAAGSSPPMGPRRKRGNSMDPTDQLIAALENEWSSLEIKNMTSGAVDKHKLDMQFRSKMLHSKKLIDKVVTEERAKAQRAEAASRTAEYKMGSMQKEVIRLKRHEEWSTQTIGKLSRDRELDMQTLRQTEEETRKARQDLTAAEEREYAVTKQLAETRLQLVQLEGRLGAESAQSNSDAQQFIGRLLKEKEATFARMEVERQAYEDELLRLERGMRRRQEEERKAQEESAALRARLLDLEGELAAQRAEQERVVKELERDMQALVKRVHDVQQSKADAARGHELTMQGIEREIFEARAFKQEMHVRDRLLSQYFEATIRAKRHLKVVRQSTSRHLMTMFGKVLLARRKLHGVCTLLLQLLGSLGAAASQGTYEDREQVQAELDDLDAMREADRKERAAQRPGQYPSLLTLLHTVLERITLMSPLLQHVVSKGQQYRATCSSFFHRGLELAKEQDEVRRAARERDQAQRDNAHQVKVLLAELKAARGQNSVLHQYLTELMRKQYGRDFVPSASLALVMASGGQPVSAESFTVAPSSAVGDDDAQEGGDVFAGRVRPPSARGPTGASSSSSSAAAASAAIPSLVPAERSAAAMLSSRRPAQAATQFQLEQQQRQQQQQQQQQQLQRPQLLLQPLPAPAHRQPTHMRLHGMAGGLSSAASLPAVDSEPRSPGSPLASARTGYDPASPGAGVGGVPPLSVMLPLPPPPRLPPGAFLPPAPSLPVPQLPAQSGAGQLGASVAVEQGRIGAHNSTSHPHAHHQQQQQAAAAEYKAEGRLARPTLLSWSGSSAFAMHGEIAQRAAAASAAAQAAVAVAGHRPSPAGLPQPPSGPVWPPRAQPTDDGAGTGNGFASVPSKAGAGRRPDTAHARGSRGSLRLSGRMGSISGQGGVREGGGGGTPTASPVVRPRTASRLSTSSTGTSSGSVASVGGAVLFPHVQHPRGEQ